MERVRATTLARIAIAAAGLDRVRPFGRGRPATLAALEHIGYAQIDTISVVGRAHAHVLQVRNPDFHPGELDRLLEARSIFEYWAHAAAYLPMRDFRFALPRMRRLAAGGTHWAGSDARTKQAVLRRIRDEGPLGARDFEAPVGHRNGWWSWKPAKAALERLFHEGALMVVSRSGFEKRFDLTERVLPAGTDTREPDAAEQAAHLVASARRALGVFRPAHVTHLRRDPALRARVAEQLDADLAEGRLRQVRILDDTGRAPWYVDADALEGRLRVSRRARLLSPFDNLVIHRDRLQALFGFDYQLECYLPAARRRYGYFALPVLLGDRFIARADCKADRRRGVLTLRHLAFEAGGYRETDLGTLRDAVADVARREGCSALQCLRVSGTDGAAAALCRSALSGPLP